MRRWLFLFFSAIAFHSSSPGNGAEGRLARAVFTTNVVDAIGSADFMALRTASPSFRPASPACLCVERRGNPFMFPQQPWPNRATTPVPSSSRIRLTAAPGKSALVSLLLWGTMTGWAACSKSTATGFPLFLLSATRTLTHGTTGPLRLTPMYTRPVFLSIKRRLNPTWAAARPERSDTGSARFLASPAIATMASSVVSFHFESVSLDTFDRPRGPRAADEWEWLNAISAFLIPVFRRISSRSASQVSKFPMIRSTPMMATEWPALSSRYRHRANRGS